jgi:hypothetical protein
VNLTRSIHHVTAIVIWLIGAWLTSTTIAQLGVPDPINYVFGLASQWILTKAQSPLWKGKGFPAMAVGSVAVDTLVNAAGAWPYSKEVGITDFWQMLRDILDDQDSQPTTAVFIVISVGLGMFTAAAAEYFWNLD